MLPNFEQARAKLECDTGACCLRARFAFKHRIPQPPAPRGLERTGPENIASNQIWNRLQAGHVAGFFVGRRLANEWIWTAEFQWIAAMAAPNIALGLSTVPLCTITAASSMPWSPRSRIGTLQVSLLPVQAPSFTQ
jgi:hypothetical protein